MEVEWKHSGAGGEEFEGVAVVEDVVAEV